MKSSVSIAGTEAPASPTRHPAWTALSGHAKRLRDLRVSSLFDDDASRAARYSLEHDGLVADFSKQVIDTGARESLVALAEQSGLGRAMQGLFSGAPLNFTESRPALHMAMRGACDAPQADREWLRETDSRMRDFVRGLLSGTIRGSTGKTIRRVVNLGIGGSDLGPRMAHEALWLAHAAPSAPDVRFAANIDPAELTEALVGAEAAETLFIISSKSFSTAETLSNARAARKWLSAELGGTTGLSQHFAAVSNAPDAAREFGVAPERVFATPAWVGGRFSLWSAVGLPLMISIGEAGFDSLCAGARSMDLHFREAPPERNIPIMLGLIGMWNSNFLDIESLAVLPYAHGLRSFPMWLQQLEMESNGKHVLRDGASSSVHTSPIVWGSAETVGQHAFHQLFYQGTRRVALDFLVPVLGDDPQEQELAENAFAQSSALMTGRTVDAARALLRGKGVPTDEIERLAPHMVCPGNQPSTTLLVPGLTPYTLGQLMALYEHKVFAQGWILGINSFDQFGVELGKEMARSLASPGAAPPHPATAGLMAAAQAMREHMRDSKGA